MAPLPEASVVFATHNRPERLRRQIAALRAQEVDPDRYEIIVVDDASGPETQRVLGEEQAVAGGPAFRAIRRERSGGPAVARNEGWRTARAPLVVFTDDDCEAPPQWLSAILAAHREHPDAFIQGPIQPIPAEQGEYGPFSHTVVVEALGPGFETANIAYPRAVLERLGGFDETSYSGPGGEDTDLAWKAMEGGVPAVWAPAALTYHAVTYLGPFGKIRMAARWHESMLPFKRYAGLREHRILGIFWNKPHFWLFRAALALLLPSRYWYLRWWLAAPYVMHLTNRRTGPLLAPYLIAHDLVEVSACVRGSLRYKVLVV